MVGRGDDTHTLPDQGFYREPRSTNGSVEDKCNVHPAFIDSPAHATHQPADGARVHREPHLGMSLMEDGQKPRQPVSEERLGGAHRERARHFSRAHASVDNRFPRLPCEDQQLPGVRQHHRSRLGERDPPAQPVEQPHLELPLQRSHLSAHTRLHVAQLRRRPRERKLLRHHPESPDLPELHRIPLLPIHRIHRYLASLDFVGHDISTALGSSRTTRITDGGEVAREEGGVRGELRSGLPAVVLLLMGTLGISTAFGMLLLLPLYVQELGGDQADFGVVLSAAAVPAVLCIGLLIRYPEALRPHVVVPLVGIGVLLGTAWAVVYAASPMAMSRMVTDQGRAAYFGYLTGTQQVGIGVGPVISRFLVETPLGFRGAFLVAGVVCLVAVALTLAVGTLVSDGGKDAAKEGAQGIASSPVSFGAAMRRILVSEAAFSLAMILLFACLFTTMTSFQPTFAGARSLDYTVFYVAYTVAVIFSRFVLAGLAARFGSRLVIAASVSVMALAVASFLAVGSNGVFYGISSAFLGLGYGLALPSVQAQAVNVSEEQVRPRVLPMAGMLFEGAILGFPLVAGWIITGFGYRALFAVLLAFALVQVAIAWWRFLVAGRSKAMQAA